MREEKENEQALRFTLAARGEGTEFSFWATNRYPAESFSPIPGYHPYRTHHDAEPISQDREGTGECQ